MLDIQDFLKAEIYGKEIKDKFIRECLETSINFFDPIEKSKLTFESSNKKVMVKQIKD